MAKYQFNYKISEYTPYTELDTRNLFDTSHCEPNMSAIDTFFEKTGELHKIFKSPEEVIGQLPNLVLLGYVSAVESYFREITRRLIVFDEESRTACENQTLTYGAAIIHRDSEMLPEALLENLSFASKKGIIEAIKNFLGIKGNFPTEVDKVLDEFSRVCQLRHCIAHRFGKLGSNNAIKLGLMEHKECLEKPLKLNDRNLQEVFLVCNNTVKIINNFLFQTVLARTLKEEDCIWTWDLRKDKPEFKKYFDVFSSKGNSFTMKEVYEAFRKTYKTQSGERR